MMMYVEMLTVLCPQAYCPDYSTNEIQFYWAGFDEKILGTENKVESRLCIWELRVENRACHEIRFGGDTVTHSLCQSRGEVTWNGRENKVMLI